MCATIWLSFYKCVGCGQCYLEVADPRWIYPLLFLDLQILEKALTVSDEALSKAALKIQMVNYKTVSIVEFEQAIREI